MLKVPPTSCTDGMCLGAYCTMLYGTISKIAVFLNRRLLLLLRKGAAEELAPLELSALAKLELLHQHVALQVDNRAVRRDHVVQRLFRAQNENVRVLRSRNKDEVGAAAEVGKREHGPHFDALRREVGIVGNHEVAALRRVLFIGAVGITAK